MENSNNEEPHSYLYICYKAWTKKLWAKIDKPSRPYRIFFNKNYPLAILAFIAFEIFDNIDPYITTSDAYYAYLRSCARASIAWSEFSYSFWNMTLQHLFFWFVVAISLWIYYICSGDNDDIDDDMWL